MKTIEDSLAIQNNVSNPSVARIQHGTVIDHITPGRAILLLRLFKLEKHQGVVSVGLNLKSARLKAKDLIKVEGWELSPREKAQIAILSPGATINLIEEGRVADKYPVAIPHTIEHLLICPNPRCITNHEQTSRRFLVKTERKEIQLECAYCERCYYHYEITQFAL